MESFHVVLARTPPCLDIAFPRAASSIAGTGPGKGSREVNSVRESFKKKPGFPFGELQSSLPAASFGEGVEPWLAAVTLVPHHSGFAAALAVAVTLCAEGACGDSRDRHLSSSDFTKQPRN